MKEIHKQLRLGGKIIKTLVKDKMMYPARLVVDIFGVVARCGILLILYSYVYKLSGGTINGTSYIYAAWSIMFYFVFSVLRLRDIPNEIMNDVKTGNIEVIFSKPISYLGYKMWWQIGQGLYSFLVLSVLASVTLYLTIGLPDTMTIGIFVPSLIITFLLGCILSLILYSIIGLLAFWIEDVKAIYWIVDKAVMVLGGSYLPVALFPPLMYKIALYSPFGAVQFVTHTVYKSWSTNWLLHFGIQLFWIIVLGLLVLYIFNKAKQKVSVNGG